MTDAALRDLTREVVRDVVARAAGDLYLSQGHAATTVDQLAEAAGLSRRSFFRYFSSKDDVLTHALDRVGHEMAASVRARPAHEAEWVSLRRGMDHHVAAMTTDALALPLTRLVLSTPELHARHLLAKASWTRQLADALDGRGEEPTAPGTTRTTALAAAAVACLAVAQAAWVDQDGAAPLADLLDGAMTQVRA